MGSGVNTILQANNITAVARANYRAATQTQEANNKKEAARVTLAEFSRTLGNQMKMEAAGKEYNYAMDQLAHELEQSGKQKLNNQLQHAEATGALAAQAGSFGVGGSSVELMDTLMDLKAATQEETRSRAVMLMASKGKVQTAQVLTNASNSFDLSQTIGNYDYQRFVEPQRMKRRLGKLIGVAVATYFGGPQAGEAVADMAVGSWKASNGDFDGAGNSFGNAAANAGKAWQQWSERGGESWGGSIRRGMNAGKTKVDSGDNVWSDAQGNNAQFFDGNSGDSGWGGWSWG